MDNRGVGQRFEHNTVVAEKGPAAARERERDRGLAAPRFSHEHECTSILIDDARRGHVEAIALPQPQYGAGARQGVPSISKRGAVSTAAREASVGDAELGAVLEIAKQRDIVAHTYTLDSVYAPVCLAPVSRRHRGGVQHLRRTQRGLAVRVEALL